VVSTDCAARRRTAGHALATSPAHDRQPRQTCLGGVSTVPVLLVYNVMFLTENEQTGRQQQHGGDQQLHSGIN